MANVWNNTNYLDIENTPVPQRKKSKASLFFVLGVLIVGFTLFFSLKDKEGKVVDNAVLYEVNGVSFNMIPVTVPEEYQNLSGDADFCFATKNFNMGETEVTRGLWYAVTGDEWAKGSPNKPVTHVSLNQIEKFLSKLTALTGTAFRIPSFSEYYITGTYFNDINAGNVRKYAWCSVNATGIKAVKKKAPNRIGLYDILGNAQEFTADLTNQWTSSNDINRIFYGGGYLDGTDLVVGQLHGTISSGPKSYNPDFSRNDIGFRLVQGGGVFTYPKGYNPNMEKSFTTEEYRKLRDCIKNYYHLHSNTSIPKTSRFYKTASQLEYDVTQRYLVGHEPNVYQSSKVKDAIVVEWGDGDNEYLLLVFSKSSSGAWGLDNIIEGFKGDTDLLFKY